MQCLSLKNRAVGRLEAVCSKEAVAYAAGKPGLDA